MKEGKMRKFADKEQTKNRHGIQTLRPLYPLWILEGAGQQLHFSNLYIDKDINEHDRNLSKYLKYTILANLLQLFCGLSNCGLVDWLSTYKTFHISYIHV